MLPHLRAAFCAAHRGWFAKKNLAHQLTKSNATAAIFVAVAALLGPGQTAFATPPDLYGVGPRSAALGLTGASFIHSFESAYLNPALLARTRRRSLSLGAQASVYDVDLNGTRYPLVPARGTTIGYTLPLPFGDVLQDRLVLGAAFFTPSNVLIGGTVPYSEEVQFPIIDRGQSLAIYQGLGIDLHEIIDGLAIGVGISAISSVVGRLDVQLDETQAFQTISQSQLLVVLSPIAGISLEQPQWGLGFNYRHELNSVMDLQIQVSDLGVTIPTLNVAGTLQYDPSTVTLEGYWMPVPQLRVVLQGALRLWSNYQGPLRATTDSSYRPPDPGLSDTISPRAAVEYTVTDGRATLALRAGYALELSPSPPARLANRTDVNGNTVTPAVPLRMVDNDRHVATLGAGLRHAWGREALSLDAFGQVHALVARTHELGATDGAEPMVSSGAIWTAGFIIGLEY